MKRCRNCNSIANDTDKFCSACGNSVFYLEQNDNIDQPTQFLAYGRNVRGDRVQMVHNFDPQNPVQQAPKAQKTKNLIGIFFAGMLFLFALGTALGIINDKIDNYEPEDILTEQSVPYTKGSFSDGVYINEWADIQIDLTDGWKNGSKEKYAKVENDYTDCGFYGEKGVNTLTISFIKTGKTTEEEREEYIKEYALEIGRRLDDAKITMPDFEIVGGYSYLYSKISGNVSGHDMIVSAYLRGIDNRVMLISVTGNDTEEIKSIVDSITTL